MEGADEVTRRQGDKETGRQGKAFTYFTHRAGGTRYACSVGPAVPAVPPDPQSASPAGTAGPTNGQLLK